MNSLVYLSFLLFVFFFPFCFVLHTSIMDWRWVTHMNNSQFSFISFYLFIARNLPNFISTWAMIMDINCTKHTEYSETLYVIVWFYIQFFSCAFFGKRKERIFLSKRRPTACWLRVKNHIYFNSHIVYIQYTACSSNLK